MLDGVERASQRTLSMPLRSNNDAIVSPDMRRQTYRLGSNYVLLAARLVAQAIDRDMIKALIFLSISRANVSAFATTTEAVTTFAGLSDVPPDDVRVPVTVYRVARGLGLPYETARRHVANLKATGLCVLVDGGLVIPRSVLQGPGYLQAIEENAALTTNLVVQLQRFGVTSNVQSSAPARDVSRQTMRLSVEYFLDAVCLMARAMELDFVDVLLLRATSLANVDRLVHDPILGAQFGGLADIPSDDHRTPVSVFAIAKFMLMPYETVRRRMNRLVGLGVMERWVHGGFVVPEAVIRPNVIAGTAEFATLTEEFLTKLSRIGVTQGAGRSGVAA